MRAPAAPGRLPGLFLFVALALLALPVLSVRVPPVLDYPNHYARMWLLAGGAETFPVSGFYAVDWTGTSTNMGIDLLSALLGVAFPASVLAPAFLVAALVLPPLGAAVLNRAIFGGWHWWQVGFAALAWNTTLLAGFLNFQIGLGLALLAAASEPAVARLRPPAAFAVRAGFAGVFLLVHVFAALFYAGLLAGLAFGPRWDALRTARGLARGAGRVAVAVLAAAVPVVALLLLAPALPGEHAGAGAGSEWASFSVWEKVGLLLSSLRNYRRGFDFALLALLAAPAVWAAATGRLRVHAGLLLAALFFVALLFASPWRMAGTLWIEERFPVMAFLALAAGLRPEPAPVRRAAAVALAGAFLAISAARTASVAQVWHERQADVAALERALAHLPPGASVLPMEHTPDSGALAAPKGRYIFSRGDFWKGSHSSGTHWHYPTLAVPWSQAFVPTLFAMRGKQPIRVLAPWDGLMIPDGIPLSIGALLAEDPTTYRAWWGPMAHHLAHWRERFDYVLVLNADMPDGTGPASPVPGLELVADEGFAQLHRVLRHEGKGAVAAPVGEASGGG